MLYVIKTIDVKRKLVILFAACALLSSCFKEVALRTEYILRPEVQAKSAVDTPEPFDGVFAYTYYLLDTLEWGVASYTDAMQKTLTAKNDPTRKLTTPDVVSQPDNTEGAVGWSRMTLTAPRQLIVAVDSVHRIYAYTQLELVENVFTLYVTLPFELWREGFSYKNGKWSFYNNFYKPLPKVVCKAVGEVQPKQTDTPTPAASLRVYAYAADTTQWYIASYADASNSKITRKDKPTETKNKPTFDSYKESPGVYALSVSQSTLMVVMVDTQNQIYAYTKQVVEIPGDAVTFPTVTFRPWTELWKEDQQGWMVINEKYKPKN